MSIKTVCTLDYGIEPDTGEDCAAALQALFDGLAYESGTEFCVQFKKGNYHIHLPIRIRGAKNLTVRGKSRDDPGSFRSDCADLGEQQRIRAFRLRGHVISRFLL